MPPTHENTDNQVFHIDVGRYLATLDVPADVADDVRSTFRDLISNNTSARRVHIVVKHIAGGHRVTVNGARWEPPPGQSVIDQLIYVLLRATLDAEPDCLHVHAGYVALAGRGVFVAGCPGSGKSTLVTKLVEDGFDYLTDERVGVDRGLRLWPLPKPVSLVRTSFPLLPHLDPGLTGHGGASENLWHVPASALRPASTVHMAKLTAIVFVQFEPRAPLLITDLHPVEAARLLLVDSPDAVRFGPDGVPLAAALCAANRCVRLVYGDTAQAVAAIRTVVLSQHTTAPAEVLTLPPSTRQRSGRSRTPLGVHSVLRRRDDVSGVCIDGRSLLHQGPHGQVVELPEAPTAWLQLFDGRTALTDIIDEVAEANELPVAQVAPMALQAARTLIDLAVVEAVA